MDVAIIERLLAAVGSLCSIVSLYISWAVYVRVKEFESRFASRIAAPELLGKLKENARSLQTFLDSEQQDVPGLQAELARCRSNVNAIAGHIGPEGAAKARRIARMIDRHRRKYRIRVWNYVEASSIVFELIAFVEDVQNWQRVETTKRMVKP